jgi:hypothetical protein
VVDEHRREEVSGDPIRFTAEGYFEACNNQKKHFMLFYMLLYNLDNRAHVFPPYSARVLEDRPLGTRSCSCPCIDNVFEFLRTPVAPDFADALTFSLLPSYFSFFMTEGGIHEFIRLLETVGDQPQLRETYARMAFVSPFFLSFAAEVFRPIISPLLPQGNPPPLGELSEQIIKKWTQNRRAVPPVVSAIFALEDGRRLLSNAFFAHALRPEAAKIFGLVEYHQSPAPAVIDALRMLLVIAGDAPRLTLDKLLEISRFSPGDALETLNEADVFDVPSLFQPVILSTLDIYCIGAIGNGGNYIPPRDDQWEVFAAWMEAAQESKHNRLEETMAFGTRAEASLRHLPQLSDPLPKFKAPPDGLDLRQFFCDYLLRRGPLTTFRLRYGAVKVLDMVFKFTDEAGIIEALGRATLERKKEIRALSAFTSITEKYTKLDAFLRPILNDIQNVFMSGDIFLACHHVLGQSKAVEFFSRDPNSAVTDYTKVCGPVREQFKNFPAAVEIAFSYVTLKFNFTRFRASRPELAVYDEGIAKVLAENGHILAADLFPQAPIKPGKWDKAKFLLDNVKALETREYMLDIVRTAALESNLFRKMREFQRGIMMAQKFIADKVPAQEMLGADEFLPIQIATMITAAPQFIVSNYVYLVEFCGAEAEEVISLTGQALLIPRNILRAVIECIKSVPIDSLIKRTL